MQVNISAGMDDQGTLTGWNYDLYSSAYFQAAAERGQGAAADWAADVTEVYGVPTAHTMWYQGESPLPPYFWRVNGATTNTWARESTMDVLAEAAGLDPVTFRMISAELRRLRRERPLSTLEPRVLVVAPLTRQK